MKIALIDQHTGYYWGWAEADSIESAATKVEHDIDGDRGQIFLDCHAIDIYAEYHAYDVADVAPSVYEDGDGQSDEIIATITTVGKYLGSVKRRNYATGA